MTCDPREIAQRIVDKILEAGCWEGTIYSEAILQIVESALAAEMPRQREELVRIQGLAAEAYGYFVSDIRDATDWPTTSQRMSVAHKMLEVEQAITKLLETP